jgi:hemerythrin
MALLEWNDSLKVNVAVIDRQHQRLVQMINDLNDAMRKGKGKDALGKILNEMVRYAMTHFSTEETYFDRYQYPETAPHKAEHASFVSKVKQFKADYDKNKVGLTIELMNFLSDWLVNHIKGTDKKYGPFFNEKGLQ